MDKLEFSEGLGKKIIKGQHHFYDIEKSEDLEHITNIKRIIVSISEHLRTEDVQKGKIKDLAENLRKFARQLYLDSCIMNRNEDEDKDVVTEESEFWFDYTYKNEKYPR
jgi:hypothetical protein